MPDVPHASCGRRGLLSHTSAPCSRARAHGDVVVVHEHEPVPHLRVGREGAHLADELLAGVVGRVRLAREHELHRAVARQEQRLEPVGLRQQERGSLVGGEPPGEPDGERAGVEHGVGPLDVARRQAPRHELVAEALAHEGDHRLAALLAGPPDLVVASVGQALPAVGVGLVPLGEHVAGEHVGHVGGHPRVGVDAVGDGGDRHLVDGHVGPEVAEHLAADLAVELGHRVRPPGEPQAHHRHVEALVGRVAGAVAERPSARRALMPDLAWPSRRSSAR